MLPRLLDLHRNGKLPVAGLGIDPGGIGGISNSKQPTPLHIRGHHYLVGIERTTTKSELRHADTTVNV